MELAVTSYREHRGHDANLGWAVNVRQEHSERQVVLELGEWRPVGAFSADAWTALTPEQARELARDLFSAADQMEARRR
jgi:hypothetical protein